MEFEKIHQIFLKAAIEAANGGANAKDLADYLQAAAKGMQINASFKLGAKELARLLEQETK